MKKTEKLTVTKRDGVGSRACAELRKSGGIPVALMGHGQPNANLAANSREFMKLFETGHRLFELHNGAQKETAILHDVQWDPFGDIVLHADFQRIDLTERVQVNVPVICKGVAAGVKAGGVLNLVHVNVKVECSAGDIPDEIRIDVSALEKGQALHVKDLPFPADVKPVDAGELVVVTVTEAQQEVTRTVEEGEPKAPEVLTERKPAEGEEAAAAGGKAEGKEKK